MDDIRGQLQAALGTTYTIERELGGGGMSRVFVATEAALDRKVVIKVLPPELGEGVSSDRFRREVQLAARLRHPHLVPLLTAGEAAGMLFYVMPLIGGESLRAHLDRTGPLPVGEATRLLREVADALRYAHAQGVVHRDLKPENVLLDAGHPLVTDFGIAKAVQVATQGDAKKATTLTSTGLALGTPAYMAPEQGAGDPTTDHRADLYSLGVLAYELLTGVAPFTGRTPRELIAAHIATPPKSVAEKRPDLPQRLSALVMRLLEKHPGDRPQSADDVILTLDTVGAPDRVAASSRRPILGLRSRGAAILASVGLAAAAFVGSWLTAGRRAGERRRGADPAADVDSTIVIVAPFVNGSGDKSLDALALMAADWITQGIEQTGIVRVVSSQSALRLSRLVADGGGARGTRLDPLATLAQESGANTVISGTIYRVGDSLQLQAELRDLRRADGARSAGSVRASSDAPMKAMESIRQQALGALAAYKDPRLQARIGRTSQAPRYEAYRAYIEGEDLFLRGDMRGATRFYEKAAALDSTFRHPLLMAAVAHGNLGEFSKTDSLVREVSRARDELSPLDRAILDRFDARSQAEGLEASRRMATLSPGGGYEYQWALDALFSNRPRETVTILTRMNPDRGEMRGWASYWGVLMEAYHALEAYDQELATAREARRRYPQDSGFVVQEARCRAALRQLVSVDGALDELERISSGKAGDIALSLGDELAAHSDTVGARDVFARVLRWYDSRAISEGADKAYQAGRARVLYHLERWKEARALIERVGGVDGSNGTNPTPEGLDILGYRGVLAARLDDRARLAGVDSVLAAWRHPQRQGDAIYWRARMAAVSGQRERAVSLLRQAISRGFSNTPYAALHTDPDLASLRGYAPFEQMLKPEG